MVRDRLFVAHEAFVLGERFVLLLCMYRVVEIRRADGWTVMGVCDIPFPPFPLFACKQVCLLRMDSSSRTSVMNFGPFLSLLWMDTSKGRAARRFFRQRGQAR